MIYIKQVILKVKINNSYMLILTLRTQLKREWSNIKMNMDYLIVHLIRQLVNYGIPNWTFINRNRWIHNNRDQIFIFIAVFAKLKTKIEVNLLNHWGN